MKPSTAYELSRITAIGMPPAWTDVWICPDADGHIQATGRDARGRKQYDETKFEHMLVFGDKLPHIRQRVEADLNRHGLPREKVLAVVVRLMERGRLEHRQLLRILYALLGRAESPSFMPEAT